MALEDLITPEGSAVIGRPTGSISPISTDFGRPLSKTPIQPGTISISANDALVTGTGTDFTRLSVGQYLKIGNLPGLKKIKTITGANSLELMAPIGAVPAVGATFKIADMWDLGMSLKATMQESLGYAEHVAMQMGAQSFKKTLNSYMVTTTIEIIEPVQEVIQKVIKGYLINYDSLTGNIKGAARTVKMWDSIEAGNGQELHLTGLIAPRTRSLDPMDLLILPNTMLYPEPKWEFDGKTPLSVELKFESLVDPNTTFRGLPVAYYLGDLSVV
ncbi:hypothetical protein [Leptospira stimsonii]|uniref:Uncharacterized protein n=1 Tax=Leptospira stimsonii TaxID=2202203 RepID=A0A396YTQ0_9LEPT|nr:hypothetical protein [Leptospira stimsonii]RHX84707.1 hypothetical protein DLM75_22060 [Leptospira stimsonii]